MARKAIRSNAVRRVCRRDDTKIKTGFAGEWLRIAVEEYIHCEKNDCEPGCVFGHQEHGVAVKTKLFFFFFA